MFDRLNLDDYGAERFDPAKINFKHGNKTYRAKFEPYRGGYGADDRAIYIWQDRLHDWRRLERLCFKTRMLATRASEKEWTFITDLWKRTRKICGPRVESYYLQLLPAKPKKKEKIYLTRVERDRDHYNGRKIRVHMSSCSSDEKPDPLDARKVWIWLGTDEELQFNVLRRRAEQLRKYRELATAAFEEAVRARISTWYANNFSDEEKYKWRRSVFTVIENEGRSYGYVVQAGQCQPVWAPPDKPLLFT